MFSTPLFIVAAFCLSSVLCEGKPCDLTDEKCLTNGASRDYEKFISGSPGVETSDPIHEDVIIVDVPKLYVKYTDANLVGMKNCKVELVRISPNDMKYDYHIGCPLVTVEATYDLKSELGPEPVEGKGTCTLEHYDYHFLLSGQFEQTVGADGKSHMQLKTHVLDFDVKGKVHYHYKDVANGDEGKLKNVIQWANENWQQVDQAIRQPVMGAFMNKFVDNVNAYLRKVSVEELFHAE